MSARAPVHTWLAEPLSEDVARFIDRVARLPDAHAVAVMPDVHLAEPACVGVVIATDTHLYPELLGSDLGCGVAAIRTSRMRHEIDDAGRVRVLEGFARAVPVLRQREPSTLTVDFSDTVARVYEREGCFEVGTLGRGNHFLELHAAEDDALWIVVHTGSRMMGPMIQRTYLARASTRHKGFGALEAASEDGQRYLADVAGALAIARESRRAILERAQVVLASVIGDVEITETIDCQHDSVLCETHGGALRCVHRKGAIALPRGERAIIPSSMGTASYVVTGKGERLAMSSSAHGAGRAVPRGLARKRFTHESLTASMRGVCFDARKTGALLDESPRAYKDGRAVMRAQRALVSVTDTLSPLVVHKGG